MAIFEHHDAVLGCKDVVPVSLICEACPVAFFDSEVFYAGSCGEEVPICCEEGIISEYSVGGGKCCLHEDAIGSRIFAMR